MKPLRVPMRILVPTLALALVAWATACAPQGGAQTRFVSIGTSDAGGSYGIMGTAMAKVINKYQPAMNISVEATPGGGLSNVRLLGKEALTFGIAASDAGYLAYRGEGAFEKEKYENIRMVVTGLELPAHIIVPTASGIKSGPQLKGKTIATTSAWTVQVYAPQTLEAYGLKPEDYKLKNMSTTEAIEALKDSTVDAILAYPIPPVSGFVDLAISRDITWLAFDEDKIDGLMKKYPYYKKVTMKAGFYPKLAQDLRLPAATSVVFTHARVDEQTIYDFTRVLLEKNPEMQEIHPAAGAFNLDRQKELLAGEVIPPLHPGVARYYKEKGFVK